MSKKKNDSGNQISYCTVELVKWRKMEIKISWHSPLQIWKDRGRQSKRVVKTNERTLSRIITGRTIKMDMKMEWTNIIKMIHCNNYYMPKLHGCKTKPSKTHAVHEKKLRCAYCTIWWNEDTNANTIYERCCMFERAKDYVSWRDKRMKQITFSCRHFI